MQFQVLFSRREPDAVIIDGVLHDGDDVGRPLTIVGDRSDSGVLDLIIPATLDSWAEEVAVVDVRHTGRSVELSKDDTRVVLHPIDARA